jgi:hypothetical protein
MNLAAKWAIICSVGIASLITTHTQAQEKTPLFIDEVRFDGTPPSMEKQIPLWGSALAAEISGVLSDSQKYSPMTMKNLEAQLGKERRKEALACADASCVNRIVENFGISESVFGVVTWLGDGQVQLTLVHMANEMKVGEAKPRYCVPGFRSIAEALQDMSEDLFSAPTTDAESGRRGGNSDVSGRTADTQKPPTNLPLRREQPGQDGVACTVVRTKNAPRHVGSSHLSTWGWATLGTGAALGVVAGILGAESSNTLVTAQKAETGSPERENAAKEVQSYWSGMIATATIGGASVLTGAILLIINEKQKSRVRQRVQIHPSPSLLGGTLAATIRF